MKIEKASHKVLLYSLFLVEASDGSMKPRQFVVERLGDASSAAKKLVENSQQKDSSIQFSDGMVEFNADEWVILKDLLKGKKSATVPEFDILNELRKKFELE